MPELQIRKQVIHEDGATNIPDLPDGMTGPVMTCSATGCTNQKRLSKCARCRSAYYCSPECQKNHWKQHKDACNMSVTLHAGRTDASEPPLQRHLRHWTARFELSLQCAAIVGMMIRDDFSNIDKFGMVIRLSPRPHANTGARFSLESCTIIPMSMFKELFTEYGMDMILAQHERERRLIKARSKGEDDFAACIAIATNTGQWKLDGVHGTEVRFKPLVIGRARARSPQLKDPSLAWLETLKIQIEKDLPTRPIGQ